MGRGQKPRITNIARVAFSISVQTRRVERYAINRCRFQSYSRTKDNLGGIF